MFFINNSFDKEKLSSYQNEKIHSGGRACYKFTQMTASLHKCMVTDNYWSVCGFVFHDDTAWGIALRIVAGNISIKVMEIKTVLLYNNHT